MKDIVQSANKKLRVLVWIVFIIGAGYLVTTQVQIKLAKTESDLKKLEVTEEIAMSVTTEIIQPESWESWKGYYGQAKAVKTLNVTSYVREIIDEVLVQIGDKVKQGQPVITLYNADQASRAQANKIELDEARLNHNRVSELSKSGGIAQAEVDKAFSAFKKAEADAQESRSKLQRTEMKSTIEGVVSSRNIEPGEVADVGKSLITIVDLTDMEAQLMVSKKDINSINKDTPVQIIIDGVTSKGQVKNISPQAQQGSGLYPVVVGLKTDTTILPGSYLEGRFLVEKQNDVVVIPADVVLYRNNKEYVYITEGDRAKLVEITTGEGRAGRIIALSGLKKEDNLVVSGNRGLSNGALVSLDKKDN